MNKHNKEFLRLEHWTSKEFIALQTIKRLLVVLYNRWKQRKSKPKDLRSSRTKLMGTFIRPLLRGMKTFVDSHDLLQSESDLEFKLTEPVKKESQQSGLVKYHQKASQELVKSDLLSGMKSSEEDMTFKRSIPLVAESKIAPTLFQKPDFAKVTLDEFRLDSLSRLPHPQQQKPGQIQQVLLPVVYVKPTFPKRENTTEPVRPLSIPNRGPPQESPTGKRLHVLQEDEETHLPQKASSQDPRGKYKVSSSSNDSRRNKTAIKKYMEVGTPLKTSPFSQQQTGARRNSPLRSLPLGQIDEEMDTTEFPAYPERGQLKKSGSKITLEPNFVPSNLLQSYSYHELLKTKHLSASAGSSNSPKRGSSSTSQNKQNGKPTRYRAGF